MGDAAAAAANAAEAEAARVGPTSFPPAVSGATSPKCRPRCISTMGSYRSMRRMWGRMASRCGQRQADCRASSATGATDARSTSCLSLLPVLVPEEGGCRPAPPVAAVEAVAVLLASSSPVPAKAATCTAPWDDEEFGWDVSSKYCIRLGGGGGATGRLMFLVLFFLPN